MANEENLKPLNKRAKSVQRKIQSKLLVKYRDKITVFWINYKIADNKPSLKGKVASVA